MALPAVIAGIARSASMAAETGGATKAAESLAGLSQQVGQLGQISAQAGPKVGMLGSMVEKATSTMTKALTLWAGVMDSAAGPIKALAEIHNPARADAFSRAMRDAYGVVGRMLTPVMDAFTRSARKLGDFMAGLEGTVGPAMDAVAALVEHIVDKFIETYQKNAPVFELMADALTKFATVMMKVVDIVFSAIGKLLTVINAVARILGFTGQSFDPKASAVGAARREARFVAPKQISDDAIRSSLMQGIGGEKKKTPEQALNEIADSTGKLWKWFETNGMKLISKAAERAGDTADKVSKYGGYVSPPIAIARWLGTRS